MGRPLGGAFAHCRAGTLSLHGRRRYGTHTFTVVGRATEATIRRASRAVPQQINQGQTNSEELHQVDVPLRATRTFWMLMTPERAPTE
jgi:hypothetical protein